jgi:hypothetical protein
MRTGGRAGVGSDLRRVVNELRSVDLARSHKDDLLCMETVFIVQEAHVQLVEH